MLIDKISTYLLLHYMIDLLTSYKASYIFVNDFGMVVVLHSYFSLKLYFTNFKYTSCIFY